MAIDAAKPFDYAADVTKQQLTLSTAVVTITVAFVKDIAKNAPADARIALYIAWGLFALAIIAGICTLLNLTGHVGGADDPAHKGIMADGIKLFATIQIVCFVVAIVGTIYFGARSFGPAAAACSTTTTRTTTNADMSTVETVSTGGC
jgi:hypothetical protein